MQTKSAESVDLVTCMGLSEREEGLHPGDWLRQWTRK